MDRIRESLSRVPRVSTSRNSTRRLLDHLSSYDFTLIVLLEALNNESSPEDPRVTMKLKIKNKLGFFCLISLLRPFNLSPRRPKICLNT